MKISARNRLKDRIVDVKEGANPREVAPQAQFRNAFHRSPLLALRSNNPNRCSSV
jgi:hypothetical protein